MQYKRSVAVIGLGYVGLPLALLAAKKGHEVIGIDNNPAKVDQIKTTEITVTTDHSRIKDVDVIVICVPTPVYEDYMPNLEPVSEASKSVAKYLKKGQLVVLESTVNPGVTETVVQPILEEISGLKAGTDFYLSHCPERINPGDTQWDVSNIPRVVGSLDPMGLEKTYEFYKSIVDAEIKLMNTVKEAEAVKVVENSFRDINIAFVNELAMSFSKLDIDVVNVIKGASTKPFAFLAHFPGCGVGGHCIPVDPYYLIEYAKKKGFHHEFLSLARKINNKMPMFTVQRLTSALEEKNMRIKDSKVAVLGVAYKPEIEDYRESPALRIIEELEDIAAEVRVYDPFVPKKSTVKSLEEALSGADAVVIATAHKEFKNLTPEKLKQHNIKVVVDGRNFLEKSGLVKAGIIYKGIGR